MMKILFLITGLNMGGAETQLFHITKKLKKNKFYEPIVVSLIKSESIITEKIKAEGIPVISLNMGKGKWDFKAIWILRRIIKQNNIKILHTHMFHANLMGRLMKLFNPKLLVISTFHNINIEGRFRELVLKYSEFLSDRTTIISEISKKSFVKKRVVSSNKLLVIPNGIDTGLFQSSLEIRVSKRKEFNFSEHFVWIAVGRFEVQKNYPALLASFKKVFEKHNHARLVLVGEGSLFQQIVNLSKELNLHDSVHFLGLRSDIPHLLAMSDAYVMSSSWEGLPVVLLEASGTGLPIVTTDVGGNSEIVMNRETGFLVQPDNVDALAQGMLDLMSLPGDQIKQMGAMGKKYIVEKYDLDHVVGIWEEIYANLQQNAKVES